MKLIAAAVVVILIVAAGAFLMMSKRGQEAQPTTVTQDQTSNESSTTGSIKSLLGSGRNVTCTITYPENGGSGTIFVANTKMRGDFTTVADTNTVESHMVSDGQFMYMWSGNQGTKISIEEATKVSGSPSPGTTQSQGADINENVDMKCSSWSVDESKFAIPADVKFTDLSSILKSIPSPAGSGSGSMDKSICNQITDPQAKAACLSY